MDLITTVSSWNMLPLSKCPPPYLAPKFLHRYFRRVNAPVSSVFWACFLMSFGLALHWLCLYMGRYYSLVCWRSPSFLCTHCNSSLHSIVPCHHCKMQVASMPHGLVSTQAFQWYKLSEVSVLPESCSSCRDCWLCMWNEVRAHMHETKSNIRANAPSPLWSISSMKRGGIVF